MKLLSDAIDSYLTYRRTAYTRSTAEASDQTMRQFMAVVGNIQTKGLMPKHAERFQSHLLSKGMKPNSVNHRMSQLSNFSKWAVANRYVPAHFVGTVRHIPVPKRPRLRIPVNEFPRLLDAAERPDYRITVAIGLFAFLRSGEIGTLKVSDVDLDTGFLSVLIHKTNDWDEMPICWDLDQELRRWFVEYARDIGRPLKGSDLLVPAHKRYAGWDQRPDTGNYQPDKKAIQLHRHVQVVLEAAGYPVETGEGVHTLRRSGARMLFDGLTEGRIGDPLARDDALRQVMAALHHKSLETTQHYIGVEADRMKRNRSIRGVRLVPEVGNVIQIQEAK